MRKIKLFSGECAIVDDKDFESISQHKWHLHKRKDFHYARSSIRGGKGKRVLMHRLIMNAPIGYDVDHINHNGLDNRRCNLRVCTRTQNQANSKPRKKSSKYKGVSWSNSENKWRAFIRINGKGKTIGRFDSELDAAEAYNNEAKKCFGEFAYVEACVR